MPIDVTEELRLCEQKESDRAPMDSWWQAIKDVCIPRDAYISNQYGTTPQQGSNYAAISDTTIIESAEGLANMMTAELTPAGESWIQFLPPFEFEDDDEIIEWYADCSSRVMRLINQSNFAIAHQDVNIERATVGTGMLMCYETGNKFRPFRFKHSHVGTYTFEEDLEGHADELRRKFCTTAGALMKEFPNGSFGDKVSTAFADTQKRWSEKFNVWHVVKKREKRDPNKVDNKNMPYEEFYLCVEDKNIIEETGQHEFNAIVSRFQSGADGSKWGVSPARKAMPAAAQVNYLQEQLDLLLDVQVNPRVLAEAGMVGEIDMRPGQKTLIKAGAFSTPGGGVRQWLDGGNYPLGKDRVQDKQNQIRKLFYHGLWADLARVEKEMTAEEVRAIRDQSEMLFVGVNARFEADLNPMLHTRVFGICLRAGVFAPPPRKLLKEVSGGWDIPDPQVSFQTNLSRVLRRKAIENSDLFLARLGQMVQYDPTLLDEFDFHFHVRELSRSFGMKAPFIRSERDVIQIAQARAAANAQQQQQQQAVQAAETAAKFSGPVQKEILDKTQMAS